MGSPKAKQKIEKNFILKEGKVWINRNLYVQPFESTDWVLADQAVFKTNKTPEEMKEEVMQRKDSVILEMDNQLQQLDVLIARQ